MSQGVLRHQACKRCKLPWRPRFPSRGGSATNLLSQGRHLLISGCPPSFKGRPYWTVLPLKCGQGLRRSGLSRAYATAQSKGLTRAACAQVMTTTPVNHGESFFDACMPPKRGIMRLLSEASLLERLLKQPLPAFDTWKDEEQAKRARLPAGVARPRGQAPAPFLIDLASTSSPEAMQAVQERLFRGLSTTHVRESGCS
jgi:hypothetical protein